MENTNENRNYLLITPAKNEEKSIGECIKSVALQSVTPILWVIVDDGSTDKTSKIIQNAGKKYRWIQYIRLNESNRDLTIHVSEVYKTGFDFSINYCRKYGLKYNYIGFLDADMILSDNDFFKRLMIEFEKDKMLGIASGEIQSPNAKGKLQSEKRRKDTISGGEMICRRECLEEIDQFPLSYAWESVLRVKALLKGWSVKRFNEIKVTQTRQTGSAEGMIKGYLIKGRSKYYLNSNPLVVFAKAIKYILSKPHLKGFSYLYGYFSSLIEKRDQINDVEIRNYFFWHKPKEILQYYLKRNINK